MTTAFATNDLGTWCGYLGTNIDIQPTGVGRYFDENGRTAVSDPYRGGLMGLHGDQLTPEALQAEAVKWSFRRWVIRDLREAIERVGRAVAGPSTDSGHIDAQKAVLDAKRAFEELSSGLECYDRMIALGHYIADKLRPSYVRLFQSNLEIKAIMSRWGYIRVMYVDRSAVK